MQNVCALEVKKDDHMLIIIKNNDDPDEYEDEYKYHALRVMTGSLNARVSAHKELHPDMEILMTINYSPNSINLWKRIRKNLGTGRNKKIDIDHCQFNLQNNYSIRNLIRDIQDIHNERFDEDI